MRRWLSYLNVTLALILVLGALGPAALSAAQRPTSAKKPVATATRTAAATTVTVIVRKTEAGNSGPEGYVAQVGGRVTKRLPIINGFAAEVPANAVPVLGSQPGVLSVSHNAGVGESWSGDWSSRNSSPDSWDRSTSLAPAKNFYLDTVRAKSVWSLNRSGIKGDGVTVAVIDSGVSGHDDFRTSSWSSSSSRVSPNVSLLATDTSPRDYNGHGTHVAGIIAGNGKDSSGSFSGMAPEADVINLRAIGANGSATEADAIEALQWVYDHADTYNIRVVNLSVNSDTPQSYNESAIDAACEILWFKGIVVVVSAGNTGPNGHTISSAPANDPFVITVGATDDKGTSSTSDDAVAAFSAFGTSADGVRKPDIYAPGRNIYSTLSKDSPWATLYPDRLDSSKKYFRLSGTSMSAPIVAGAAALLLDDEPSLTPDQVKYRLTTQCNSITDSTGARYPYLDAYKAVTARTTASANTGTYMSRLLTTGDTPVLQSSVMWRSVMWRSVMWNSVMWRSVMWNSVMWRSADAIRIQSVMWN